MPKAAAWRSPRILSVQSHVVSGYCGNKSATFPLQLLDYEVDVINSVQLSNHTQYRTARGQIFDGGDFDKIHTGLAENELLKLYDQVITGYVADCGYLEAVAKLIKDTQQARKEASQDCFVAVDPVLGDDETGYYVPNGADMAAAYKKHMLPLADLMTPNRFEASVLSGIEIDQGAKDGLKQALNAINLLHKQTGIQMIALTSLQLQTAPDELVCLVSHWPGCSNRQSYGLSEYRRNCQDGLVWSIIVPKLEGPFTGTGDLFTALLTAWLAKTKYNFRRAIENSANTIRMILEDTKDWSDRLGEKSVQSRELRLIQNREHILNPTIKIKASPMRLSRELNASLSMTKVQATEFQSSDKLPLTD